MILEVYDPDNFIGGSGDKRLPKVSKPDMKKVDLLGMQIRNIMGDMLHRAYASYLVADDFKIGNWKQTVVVDATDAPIDKRRVWWDAAKAAGARVIRASYEGHNGLGGGIALVSKTLPFQKSGDTSGNYASAPDQSLSFLAAGLAASMIRELVRSGRIEDIQVEIPVSLGASFEAPIVETHLYPCEDPDCPNTTELAGTYCAECCEESEEPF